MTDTSTVVLAAGNQQAVMIQKLLADKMELECKLHEAEDKIQKTRTQEDEHLVGPEDSVNAYESAAAMLYVGHMQQAARHAELLQTAETAEGKKGIGYKKKLVQLRRHMGVLDQITGVLHNAYSERKRHAFEKCLKDRKERRQQAISKRRNGNGNGEISPPSPTTPTLHQPQEPL